MSKKILVLPGDGIGQEVTDAAMQILKFIIKKFNLDTFIENCKSAVENDDTHLGIKDLVGKAVSEPGSLMKAIGEPSKAGASPIYSSNNLTIVNVVWAPWMTIYPHNHNI